MNIIVIHISLLFVQLIRPSFPRGQSLLFLIIFNVMSNPTGFLFN